MKLAHLLSLAFGGLLCLVSSNAHAQGLIWFLPEEGTVIRHEGTYTKSLLRPGQDEGNEDIMQWQRHLEVRSVGRENALYKGEQVPCRWLEFEVTTGDIVEGEIRPGPGGKRIYKILVPEQEITGQMVKNDIPVAQIPIIKGYRRIGNSETETLQSNIFQLYPVVSMLRHYPNLKQVNSAENISIPALNDEIISSSLWQGSMEMENETDYSQNSAKIWRSDKVPFGLAKWEVTIIRKKKKRTDPRTVFAENDPYTTIRVEMSAHVLDTDAQSALEEN